MVPHHIDIMVQNYDCGINLKEDFIKCIYKCKFNNPPPNPKKKNQASFFFPLHHMLYS